MSKITECPHCGSEEYYVNITFKGRGAYRYRFDGETADNHHLHDCCTYPEKETVYCGECQKRLGTKKSLGLEIR